MSGTCRAGSFDYENCQCAKQTDCDAYEDGNLCNGNLYCDLAKHSCVLNPASVVSCPSVDDTACKRNLCDATDGKCKPTPVFEDMPCDTGSECLPGTCTSGVCGAGSSICECISDSDCMAMNDLCEGSYYCKQTTHTCELNPTTVVTCPSVDGTACLENHCNPANGQCEMTPINEGQICDSGNQCYEAACENGACINAATTKCQCESESDTDCAAYEDGDLCNGTLYCNKSSFPFACDINPATIASCSTAGDGACSQTACNPTTVSCVQAPVVDGTACELGDGPCSVEACAAGTCTVVLPDICECQTDADCLAFEDGDLCNGTLYCDKASAPWTCEVNPATVVPCPEFSNMCDSQSCDRQTGTCSSNFTPPGIACDAGDSPCTVDSCDGAGNCVPDPSTCACQTDADCTLYADYCTGPYECVAAATPYCNVVGPGPCDDGNPCTYGSCESVSQTCYWSPALAGDSCGTGLTCDGAGNCG